MDHRTVPLEVLREFARSHLELTSLRAVAEDAGVGRSTVHKFVTAGTTPHPRVRRLLGLWYLRQLDGVDETEIARPYIAALEVLLGDVPQASRRLAAADVLDGIGRGYSAGGETPPRWVEVVRKRTTGPNTGTGRRA